MWICFSNVWILQGPGTTKNLSKLYCTSKLDGGLGFRISFFLLGVESPIKSGTEILAQKNGTLKIHTHSHRPS